MLSEVSLRGCAVAMWHVMASLNGCWPLREGYRVWRDAGSNAIDSGVSVMANQRPCITCNDGRLLRV